MVSCAAGVSIQFRWPAVEVSDKLLTNTLRVVIVVAFLAARSVADLLAQDGAAADGTADLRQLTERRFDANAANDRAFYERLLAENALILLSNRRPQTKKEYIDDEFLSRPAGYRGKGASIADFRALVDHDTAVVSYLAIEPTPLGEQTFEMRTGRIDTYVRIKDEWCLLSMTIVDLPSWPDVATIDAGLYSEYAGTYQLSADVFIIVTNEAGHLMSEMTGQPKVELFPESATSFFDRTDNPFARTVFERDSSGKVVAHIYRAQGQKLRARKIQ
jgi:hypothetical protein